MNSKQMKQKKPKTFLWYLDKLLMLIVAGVVIAGIVTLVIAIDNDDAMTVFAGIAMLSTAGILMTPNIIIYAIKDSRGWQDKAFSSKLLKEEFFREISDHEAYHKRICTAVIREAVLNFLALIGVLAFIVLAAVLILDGDIDEGSFGIFLILLGLIIFAIPMIAYNMTCAVYRIRTVQRCEYFVYRSKVKAVDGYNMKIVGKYGIYKFKYCKCLGIRADDVYETDAILVFVPDEVYLLPGEER